MTFTSPVSLHAARAATMAAWQQLSWRMRIAGARLRPRRRQPPDWGATIARCELTRLLEDETFNAAAQDIGCGHDPRVVLRRLGPSRYDDEQGRDRRSLFLDIAAGRTRVTD